MSIADQWRERLTGWYYSTVALPAELNNSSLNQLVMQLPTGVYAMKQLQIAVDKNEGGQSKPPSGDNNGGGGRENGPAADYKIIPTDLSLQEYIKESFINTLGEPKNLPIFTLPIYLRKKELEGLENWPDWKALKAFLAQSGLMPFVVFKNAPKSIPNVGTCYLCDIRVGWVE